MFFVDIRTDILDADPRDGGGYEESRLINSMVFQIIHHALSAYAGTLPVNKPALGTYGSPDEIQMTCDVGISLPHSANDMVGDLIRLHGSRSALLAVLGIIRERIREARVMTTERTVNGPKEVSIPLSVFVPLISEPCEAPEGAGARIVTRVRFKGNSAIRRMQKRYQARNMEMPFPLDRLQSAADRRQFPVFFVKSAAAVAQSSRAFPIIVRQEHVDRTIPERFSYTDFSTYGMAKTPNAVIPFF